jgi:hypothetical protein
VKILFLIQAIILPDIGSTYRKIFKVYPKPTKIEIFHLIFSLRIFSYMILYLTLIVKAIFEFIDLWGFTVFRFSTPMHGISATAVFISFSMLAILWQHYLNQTSEVMGSYSRFIKF